MKTTHRLVHAHPDHASVGAEPAAASLLARPRGLHSPAIPKKDIGSSRDAAAGSTRRYFLKPNDDRGVGDVGGELPLVPSPRWSAVGTCAMPST